MNDLIISATKYLQKRGIERARYVAEELLSALLQCKRWELFFPYDLSIKEDDVKKYFKWIERRGNREPLEYIVGRVEFLDCTIMVCPGVFIPRQETEILATLALKEISDEAHVLWDLCTGSGCLGLGVKKKRPNLEVTLSDLSERAIAIAKKNAQANELCVNLICGDLLEPFFNKKANVVLCNPPYVFEKEYDSLEDEVRLYEPKEALVGGVRYFTRLAKELPSYLTSRAKVFLEIGATQSKILHQIFDKKYWKKRWCKKDWAGHDRFFFLEFQ